MAIVNTNWKAFLSPDSDLPPDVFFRVGSEDENIERGDNSGKIIQPTSFCWQGSALSSGSSFFRGMKEEKNEIEVKNTTAEAFQNMVNFIYRRSADCRGRLDLGHGHGHWTSCPQNLCEMLELSERYQMSDLKAEVKGALEMLWVDRKNMIFTATVARNYKIVSDDMYEMLSTKCLTFHSDTMTNTDVTKENFPEASLDILLELKKVKEERILKPGNRYQTPN